MGKKTPVEIRVIQARKTATPATAAWQRATKQMQALQAAEQKARRAVEAHRPKLLVLRKKYLEATGKVYDAMWAMKNQKKGKAANPGKEASCTVPKC